MNDRHYVAQSLFQFLEHCEVEYCVVGDSRQYPEAIPSDIDIVVPGRRLGELPRLVARFCREIDVHLVQLIRHEQTAVYFVLAWIGESGEARFLAVDFCSDYLRGGRRLLGADEMLAHRGPVITRRGTNQGFRVPAPHMQFIYYLVKKVDKQDLNSRHGDYLSSLWQMDPEGCWGQLTRFWRADQDADLLAAAATRNGWYDVRAELPRLRRAMRRAAPLTVGHLAGELQRRISRVLRPTGLVVAFLGADGSGKSSVIDRVLADLAPAFRRTCYLHLRPRLISRAGRDDQPATAPHKLPARGRLASFAKLAFFLFDYIAGHALRVWPLKRRSALVVFDRHYRDLAVDSRRYRYGGSMRLARWAARLVPEPDFWVLLDAPAEILQSRKQEVPAEESERQRHAYLDLAAHLHDAVVVDASHTLPHVVAGAESAILRWLEGRLEFRHPELQFEQNPVTARLLQYFCRKKPPVLGKLFRVMLNSDVYCRIHSPILMAHPYGIIIHADAEIGRRVAIMQQVTLGGKDWGVNEAPVIEDDVYVGAGAKVLGAVRVGRGAIVGANAVVTRDVPPYCTVVGANRVVRVPEYASSGADAGQRDNHAPADERLSA